MKGGTRRALGLVCCARDSRSEMGMVLAWGCAFGDFRWNFCDLGGDLAQFAVTDVRWLVWPWRDVGGVVVHLWLCV